MRHCNRCGLDKPQEEWYTGFAWCKPCRKQYDREYHKGYKAKRAERNRSHRADAREFINSLKTEVPCADCGNVYHFAAMEFDHLPQYAKKFNIADACRLNYSVNTIKKEVAKCEIVCSNCHKIRTYTRRQMGVG